MPIAHSLVVGETDCFAEILLRLRHLSVDPYDLRAERRLRSVQTGGSARERPLLCDGDEGL
jgi:hypothetical protein